MQNIGIWAHLGDAQNNATDFQYGIFKLPTPAGGKYVTVGGGWAFVANAKGADPEDGGRVLRLGVGFDGQRSRFSASPTGARWPRATCRRAISALEQSGRHFSKGTMRVFSEEIYPGTRAEPRVPPEVYKIISDAIQARQLGGADCQQTAAAAAEQLDAFLAAYSRRADPVSPMAQFGSTDDRGRFMPSHRSRERQAIADREWLAGYLFVLPDALGLFAFVGVPMMLALGLGFFEVDGFGGYRFVGFANSPRCGPTRCSGRACEGHAHLRR